MLIQAVRAPVEFDRAPVRKAPLAGQANNEEDADQLLSPVTLVQVRLPVGATHDQSATVEMLTNFPREMQDPRWGCPCPRRRRRRPLLRLQVKRCDNRDN